MGVNALDDHDISNVTAMIACDDRFLIRGYSTRM